MDQDSGGKPHITIGDTPEPEDRVTDLWVLICTMPDGGEGVYGQTVGSFMVNFIATDLATKDAMETYLREHGTVEVCRRQGRALEWRHTALSGEGEEIT